MCQVLTDTTEDSVYFVEQIVGLHRYLCNIVIGLANRMFGLSCGDG